jgi:glycosyltransferase involved in cell wall biosynthesis
VKIIALTRYDSVAASSRQRFQQFAPALSRAGFTLELRPFFGNRETSRINSGVSPGLVSVGAYAQRFVDLAATRGADICWIQYECLPFMPSIIERLAAPSTVPFVVDYDDAYYLRYDLHRSRVARFVLTDKMKPLVSRAAAVVAGNDHLASYLGRWNPSVELVPTVVDLDRYAAVPSTGHSPRRPTIGWIGSPSTWSAYVRPMLPIIKAVCEANNVRFLVIGAGDTGRDRFDLMEARDWSEEREIADIQEMDIGIMPLTDDPWARGKCGYKLIQYLACCIPTVASPVGVNVDLADGGRSGILAKDEREWVAALQHLLDHPELRATLGANGRRLVERNYSLQAQAPRIVDLFRSVVRPD